MVKPQQDTLIDTGAVKQFQLYKGEVILNFRLKGHRYEVNGREVAGVTTILKTVIAKEALINWAVKMTREAFLSFISESRSYEREELIKFIEEAGKAHRQVLKTAGNTGIAVHDWIEQYIKAKIRKTDVPLVPDVINRQAIESFLDWEKAHTVEYLESERPVYSKKHNYCGTLDFIAKVNNVVTLGDIKTSNYIYPEQYFLQVAGYQYAYEEERTYSGGLNAIANMLIIRVPKTIESNLEVIKVGEYEENAKAFIRGVYLYERIVKLKNYYK